MYLFQYRILHILIKRSHSYFLKRNLIIYMTFNVFVTQSFYKF